MQAPSAHMTPHACLTQASARACVARAPCPALQALAKFAHLRHLDVSFSGTPGALSDVAGVAARLPELRQLHLRGAGLSGPLGCDLMRASRCVERVCLVLCASLSLVQDVVTGKAIAVARLPDDCVCVCVCQCSTPPAALAPCSKLEVLSLSDNDRLTGSLPGCWLAHPSLHELQLAGLSGLTGPLPDITSAPQPSSATSSTAAAAGERDGEQLCGFGRLKYINLAGVIGDAGVGFTGAAACFSSARWRRCLCAPLAHDLSPHAATPHRSTPVHTHTHTHTRTHTRTQARCRPRSGSARSCCTSTCRATACLGRCPRRPPASSSSTSAATR
jgi:hypothetical protein